MRKRLLSVGLSVLGIAVSGLSLAHCSFSLEARQICADGGSGCMTNTDLGGNPPDLAMDPDDPGKPGPYKVARPQASIRLAAADVITTMTTFAPSTDGTTVDRSRAPYPLIMIAPSQFMSPEPLSQYAERLASHGFLVVIYQVRDQANHINYRNGGLVLLNEILTSTDPVLMSLADSRKIGLIGYELGAKISAAMAVQDTRVGALFMIDPVDVPTATGPIIGPQETSQVSLPTGVPIAFQGGTATAMAAPACYPAAQGYKPFYDAVTRPALLIEFVGGALGDYVANYPDPPCAAGSTVDKTRTQALTQKYMTAYFQWELKGRQRSRDYLLGADFQADMTQGMLSQSKKGL